MSVLEFAILSIKPSHAIETPELKSGLQDALQVLSKSSGFPFSLHQQVEDPQIVYLLGSWNSIEAHNAFLPSPENLALLEKLKDYITVRIMFHADIDRSIFPLNAPCVAFNRHFIKPGQKDAFEKVWRENKHHLQDFVKPYSMVGGWRIDGIEEGSGGEWVQFTGFSSVEHHHDFAKTEEFKEYGKIREFLEGAELMHAKKLEW